MIASRRVRTMQGAGVGGDLCGVGWGGVSVHVLMPCQAHWLTASPIIRCFQDSSLCFIRSHSWKTVSYTTHTHSYTHTMWMHLPYIHISVPLSSRVHAALTAASSS